MEAERPRQRRRINEPTTSIHAVPDDLLRLILLRLDSPLWLLRAASACRLFRRAVAGADGGRAFLRHAASLHPPVVVGHYHVRSGRPIAFVRCPPNPRWLVPSSPPPPAIGGRRFSLGFLPQSVTTTANWEVVDCHGGLVLLRDNASSCPRKNLIVCDPLTRRYQGIDRPPPPKNQHHDYFAGTFLLDSGDGSISISNFRVMCHFRFYADDDPEACVFSAADGDGWRFLRQSPADCCMGHVAGRVDGSLYLNLWDGGVVALDRASLEFSEVNLPIIAIDGRSSLFTVVHGAGGPDLTSPPTTTWIIHVYGEKELEFFRLVRGAGGGEWVLEHTISNLSEATHGLPGCPEKRLELVKVGVVAVGTGTAVLSACDHRDRKQLFSIDMETKKLQAVANKKDYSRTYRTFAYTLPWPQFLRACPS